jgi:hypothetical protein
MHAWVAEYVVTGLYGPVTFQREYFETSPHQVSPDFATDICSNSIDERLAAARESRLIVIELEIFRDKGTELHEIAPVVSIEHHAIETSDGREKRVARLWVCGRL